MTRCLWTASLRAADSLHAVQQRRRGEAIGACILIAVFLVAAVLA